MLAPARVSVPLPFFVRFFAPVIIPETVKLPELTSSTESSATVMPRLTPRSMVPAVPRVAPPKVSASAAKAAETSPRLLAAVMLTRPWLRIVFPV